MKYIASFVAFLFALSVSAAQSVVQHIDIQHSLDGTLSVPKFDQSIGHLIKADLVATVDCDLFAVATPLPQPPFDAILTLTYSSQVGYLIDEFSQISTSVTFGTSGALEVEVIQMFYSTVKLRGTDLSHVIGDGVLEFPFSIVTNFSPDPVADMSTDIGHCNVSVSITYTYN